MFALRVIVSEWQQRPAARLAAEWSEEEDLSLQNVKQGGGLLPGASLALGSIAQASPGSAFDTDAVRHRRIFNECCEEKVFALKVSEALIGFAQPPEFQSPRVAGIDNVSEYNAKVPGWLYEYAREVWLGQRGSTMDTKESDPFAECVDSLKTRLELAANNANWPSIINAEPRLAISFTRSLIGEIVVVLRILLLHVNASKALPLADQVVAWYEMMDRHSFLAELQVDYTEAADLVLMTHCLVALISTSLLKVSLALEHLQITYAQQSSISYPDIAKPYLEDEGCIKLLSSCLLGATAQSIKHASPAVLAWSIVAQNIREVATLAGGEQQRQLDDGSSDSESTRTRRTSTRDPGAKQRKPEMLLEMIMDLVTGEDDPIAMLGGGAVNDLRVLEVVSEISQVLLRAYGDSVDMHTTVCGRLVAYELIRDAIPLIKYGPEIAQPVLSALTYDGRSAAPWPAEPARTLLEDGIIMGPRFMDHIISRYPHEMSPFLACLSALSRSVASVDEGGSRVATVLDNMVNFTRPLPNHFEGYDLVREDENANCIRLTQDIPVLAQHASKGTKLLTKSTSERREDQYFIPAGTVGFILNDNRPFVVCWQYEHSSLEYLGKILSTRVTNATILNVSSPGTVDQEVAADIVGFMSDILGSLVIAGNVEAAGQLLGRFSNGLDRNDDILRVVFEIFERELQTKVDRPGIDEALILLANCVKFMIITLSVYPDRVWSFLLRSKLLAVDENSGAFAAIVGSTEVPAGEYRLLRSCVDLFGALVNDAVKRAVSRNGVTKTLTRFQEQNLSSGTTPEKTMSVVLVTMVRVMLDVFASQTTWKFALSADKGEMNTSILNSLKCIMDSTYGIDDANQPGRRLTSFFATASEIILDASLASADQSVLLQPALDIFVSSTVDLDSSSTVKQTSAMVSQAIAASSLCSTVLKVGILLNRRGGWLLTQLFEAVPVLARLYALHSVLKPYLGELLTVIVQASNIDGKEPPSLLGHLSSEATKHFLVVMTQLDLPLRKVESEIKIWDLLSAVVSNKQQWLAICLLTGTTPRDRLKNKSGEVTKTQVKPLLSYALDELSKIGTLAPRRAIAMLSFVSLSQKHWPWATNDIGRHQDFVKNITDWLADLSPLPKSADAETSTRFANENQMAAYIADILATYLYNDRQGGMSSNAKTIASKMNHLVEDAVAVDGYNHSLHRNLEKNFGLKFHTCTLASFKRTALSSTDYGRNYYYDLDLMTKVLDFEPSWTRNKQGFVNEVARANINLSVVESQVSLLRSWKALAVELSTCAGEDPTVQRDLAKVVENCLKANMDTPVPAVIFENLAQLRAELAFVLLQRLVNLRSKEPLVRDLARVAWDIIRTCGQSPDVASAPKDAEYYQSLLRILFLSLQPHVYEPVASSSLRKSISTVTEANKGMSNDLLNPILLEILQNVIAVNFRALCSNVHEDPASVQPSEFVLLTALLQTILRIPSIAAVHQQIGLIFADASMIRLATSLYSWSDSLADPATLDPIYGEIGILFLLSLSTVQLLAEQMAVEGVLSHLSSANITQYLRKSNGKGPFDNPVRMHDIWTRGLLPLCLNLLEAVGPPIAMEIASFVNSFPAQLERAQSDLQNVAPSMRHPHAGAVTLGLASEIHSLALLSLIIERLKAMGPAAGVVSAEIPSLIFDRVAVKEEVEGMLRSRRSLRERITPVGEREAEWARAKADRVGTGAESRLEEKIVVELEAVVDCLNG